METKAPPDAAPDLAGSIVVKTRWFGIIVGILLVETRTGLRDPMMLRAFLALGAGYAILDTIFHRRGDVFLKGRPLFVSFMEALFIGLLSYYDTGLESPFRFYYLLSLMCCAFRHSRRVAWVTFAFDCLSLGALAWTLRGQAGAIETLPLMVVMLAWVTWASSSLAGMLKAGGERLRQLNADLERNREELERRVAERTAALRASQARVIHQEKMAAFGLLAAGIAHEVGNPLTAISSLIQMLQRRNPDPYTSEKLELAHSQLGRIQRTIRELVDFARPAATSEGLVRPSDVLDEALGIAKYYHRTKDRDITTDVPAGLPRVRAVKDRLTQVVLNLVLNAIDATGKGGTIHLEVRHDEEGLRFLIVDNGRGVPEGDLAKLFQPYFTTKPQGTGLGLFVSRQIVEELGGTLTCRSIEGRGTTLEMRLPASRCILEELISISGPAPTPAGGTPPRPPK